MKIITSRGCDYWIRDDERPPRVAVEFSIPWSATDEERRLTVEKYIRIFERKKAMTRKLIVVDTETGGLDPSQHVICSLGAVVYNDGGIEGTFYTLVKDEGLTTEEAMKVNGISQLQLAEAPNAWRAVQDFKQFLLRHMITGQVTLVAHKAEFDASFMRRLYAAAGEDFEAQFGHRFLCTQACALLLDYAGKINLPGGSASLDSVAEALRIKPRSTEHHNALEDAMMCATVLRRMVELMRGARLGIV